MMLLFFTAGELVRARLPEHEPFAFRFGTWRRTRESRALLALLRREWLPYLEGRRTREDAIGAMIRSLPRLQT